MLTDPKPYRSADAAAKAAREARLPKWAQEEISDLRRALTEKTIEARQLFEERFAPPGEAANVLVRRTAFSDEIPFAPTSRTRYLLKEPERGYDWIEVGLSDAYRAPGEYVLDVRGERSIEIRPLSGNHVEIALVRRG